MFSRIAGSGIFRLSWRNWNSTLRRSTLRNAAYGQPQLFQGYRKHLRNNSSWPVRSNSPRPPSANRHFQKSPYQKSSPVAWYLGLGLVTSGGLYYVVHLESVPYTGRRRMIDISRSQEISMGEAAFSQLLEQNYGRVLPSSDPRSKRVKRIGVRIAKTVKQERPELLEGFKWQFVVVDAPGVVNAVCLPGGKVLVYSGLLEITRNDDALAAVLGHEISHVLLRHSAELLSFTKILFAFQVLLNTIVDFSGITSILVQLLLRLPYSRKVEREADIVGLRLMADACYDPSESPRMFQRLAALEGKGENPAKNMLSSHPMFSDRIERINKHLPDQERRYNDKCAKSYTSWSSAMTSRW